MKNNFKFLTILIIGVLLIYFSLVAGNTLSPTIAGFIRIEDKNRTYISDVICYKEGVIKNCSCNINDLENQKNLNSNNAEEKNIISSENLIKSCELEKELKFNVWNNKQKAGTFKISSIRTKESCAGNILVLGMGDLILNNDVKKEFEKKRLYLLAINNNVLLSKFYILISKTKLKQIKLSLLSFASQEFKKQLKKTHHKFIENIQIEKFNTFDGNKDNLLEAVGTFTITIQENNPDNQNSKEQIKYFLFVIATFNKSAKLIKVHISKYFKADKELVFYNAGQETFITLTDIDSDGKAEIITFLSGYDSGTYQLYIFNNKNQTYKPHLMFGIFAC